jgi:predicted transposase/invertase (TIGR01784 family)
MTDEKTSVPEILPPSEDGVFKTLLTHPGAKPVLRDLISSVLQIPIADVEVRNNELPISGIEEKRERFDVNCKIGDGRQADVEMQAESMEGDSAAAGHENLRRRAVYNLCDLHASQKGRGISYRDMMQSYQITFCGFTVFPGREGAVTGFSFRSEDGEEFSDAVSIVFVELPKFSGAMKKPVSEMSSLEMWGIFFGQANKPECGELLREMVLKKEEIKVASELLASISKDEIERAHYRSRRMFRMDMEHNMAVAREEGLEKGKLEGMREGKLEGMREGKLEGMREGRAAMVRSLLKSGVSADVIAGASGLSAEEVLKLSN